MIRIESAQNGKGAAIYLNKAIRLIIEDGDRVQPRDGILRDIDDVNYWVEMLHGEKKGQILGFLKLSVKRIEPLDYKQSGDFLINYRNSAGDKNQR